MCEYLAVATCSLLASHAAQLHLIVVYTLQMPGVPKPTCVSRLCTGSASERGKEGIMYAGSAVRVLVATTGCVSCYGWLGEGGNQLLYATLCIVLGLTADATILWGWAQLGPPCCTLRPCSHHMLLLTIHLCCVVLCSACCC